MAAPTFQEQQLEDLDRVFFNTAAMEFAERHEIAGIRGSKASPAFACTAIVDRERYMEQRASAKSENVSLNGFSFFIKRNDWPNALEYPKVRGKLLFDKELYEVIAVNDDMGMIEVMLEIPRG